MQGFSRGVRFVARCRSSVRHHKRRGFERQAFVLSRSQIAALCFPDENPRLSVMRDTSTQSSHSLRSARIGNPRIHGSGNLIGRFQSVNRSSQPNRAAESPPVPLSGDATQWNADVTNGDRFRSVISPRSFPRQDSLSDRVIASRFCAWDGARERGLFTRMMERSRRRSFRAAVFRENICHENLSCRICSKL